MLPFVAGLLLAVTVAWLAHEAAADGLIRPAGVDNLRWRSLPRVALVVAGSVALTAFLSVAVLGGPSPATAVVLMGMVGLFLQSQRSSPAVQRWAHRLFAAAFALYAAAAVAFLILGLVPFVARMFPAFRGPLIVEGGPQPPVVQVVIEYLFSALNVGLAIFLMRLRPRHRTARLLAIGMAGTGAVFNQQAHSAITLAPLFAPIVHEWFHLVAGLTYLYAVVLFPDGKLKPSWQQLPAWRWPLRAAYYGLLPIIGFFFVSNVHGGDPVGYLIIFGALIPVTGLSAQIFRYRHAESFEERQQSRLLITTLTSAIGGAVTFGVLALLLSGAGGNASTRDLSVLVFRVFPALFAVIPVILFGILVRYRLWNIDRVLNRTFVYGALASFIGVVYVGVVLAGNRFLVGDRDANLALSIVATAVVAVTFQPLRERVQRIANRLVYGRRSTPYEVLSRFSDQVVSSYAADEVLARMARVVAEGTGSARADVWLVVGHDLVRAASWPEAADGVGRVAHGQGDVALAQDDLPPLPHADRAVAVAHRSELLGALTVAKPSGEGLTPAEGKLLADMAAQAGLVLRNVRLTEELRARLDEITEQAAELRSSRQRIVAAQDAERRRLERDIHDGAQQHLVALAVKLGLARSLAGKDPVLARAMVGELQREVSEALETLRNLARGIYPAILTDQGLIAALQAHADRYPVPVHVAANGIGHLPQDVETAVYFCCLEALQNIGKHAAGATQAEVRVEEDGDGQLRFAVSDDGMGFDPATAERGAGIQNMADRLAALDGALSVVSQPGRGTLITGSVPVRRLEPVP